MLERNRRKCRLHHQKLDESKGNHYSNLCWSKKGVGLSHNSKSNFNVHPKFTKEEFEAFVKKQNPKETITAYLKRTKTSTKAYYTAKKKYDKKENR